MLSENEFSKSAFTLFENLITNKNSDQQKKLKKILLIIESSLIKTLIYKIYHLRMTKK